MEKWLETEGVFDSGYLYSLYCKTFELACLFPCARQELMKTLVEEDIMKGSLVYFVRRLEGLTDNYDYEHLYDEICELRQEIIMGF